MIKRVIALCLLMGSFSINPYEILAIFKPSIGWCGPCEHYTRDPSIAVKKMLEEHESFLQHIEKKIQLPLVIKIDEDNLEACDVTFVGTPTTGVITIKEEVLRDFIPEIIEVVIAARVARWMERSPLREGVTYASHGVELAGGTLAALSGLILTHRCFKTRIFSLETDGKCVLAGLAGWSGAQLLRMLLEWQRTRAEYDLTKNLIVNPEAQSFLSRLSADSRAALNSPRDLRFLFEKFRKRSKAL